MNRLRSLFSLFLFVGIAGTALFYMSKPHIWQFGILALYIVIMFWMLARQWNELRLQWGKALASLLLALAWIYSSHGRPIHTFHWTTWILALIALLTIGFTFYLAITELEHPFQPTVVRRGPLLPVLYGIIPFCVWMLYLLVYYPGKMTYDSFWQWDQAHGIRPYNNWHPVLHTWLIQALITIWNSPAALVLLQMIVLSCVVAFAMTTLQRFGMPLGMVIFIDLVYALDPVNGFYVITLWKDILFATMILLLCVLLARAYQTNQAWLRSNRNIIALGVVAFLAMNLRDNGPEVVVAVLILSIAFFRGVRIRLSLVSAVVVVCYFILTGPVFQAAHVEKNPLNQALAIPSQQIGATYHKNGRFTPELKSYFNSILPAENWARDYDPYTVDPIKHDKAYNDQVITDSFSTYLKNWAKLLALNPVTFVSAYLNQTAAIWQFHSTGTRPYFDSSATLQWYPLGMRMMAPTRAYHEPLNKMIRATYDGYAASLHSQYPNAPVPNYTTFRTHALQAIEPLHTKPVIRNRHVQKLFRDFFAGTSHYWANYFAKGALPLFVLITSFIAAVRRFGWRVAAVYTPAAFVIITIAMGMPATDFRYSFSFILSVPFLVFLGKLRSANGDET